MRTNHLAIAALSALVCVLAWTVLGKPSTGQSHAARPFTATAIKWERQPANCEGECLKGHRWGIRHAADLDQQHIAVTAKSPPASRFWALEQARYLGPSKYKQRARCPRRWSLGWVHPT